ncbi:MAG: hypothetical protein NT070_14985 [Cyanobacteria bacterium]|nr:hypothetical protein [Cyanobacteriota bacterium]
MVKTIASMYNTILSNFKVDRIYRIGTTDRPSITIPALSHSKFSILQPSNHKHDRSSVSIESR